MLYRKLPNISKSLCNVIHSGGDSRIAMFVIMIGAANTAYHVCIGRGGDVTSSELVYVLIAPSQ